MTFSNVKLIYFYVYSSINNVYYWRKWFTKLLNDKFIEINRSYNKWKYLKTIVLII